MRFSRPLNLSVLFGGQVLFFCAGHDSISGTEFAIISDMKFDLSSEMSVLKETASAVARERDVRNGNQCAAGRELGVSPRMMCCKLRKAGIVR